MNGQHSYQEIITQADAWEDALAAFAAVAPELRVQWRAINPTNVVFTGCGSTYYLSLTAASLFQQLTGIPARACPASELLLASETVLTNPAKTLLVTISRSGTTTETITAVSKFRQQGGAAVWTITCYPESPLAQASDLVLPAVAGQERSVAQTRSFSSMLLLAQALAAHLGGADWSVLKAVPNYGRSLLSEAEPIVQKLAGRLDLTRFAFLGSSSQFGIANEAMLKMTEMSLTVAAAFHFLEYRHGPMSMATEETAVIGLLSPMFAQPENQVLDEMVAKGATVLRLACGEGDISLAAHLPTWVYPILYLPPLQLLAYHRATSKKLDPDNPRHLTAVVHLDTAVF